MDQSSVLAIPKQELCQQHGGEGGRWAASNKAQQEGRPAHTVDTSVKGSDWNILHCGFQMFKTPVLGANYKGLHLLSHSILFLRYVAHSPSVSHSKAKTKQDLKSVIVTFECICYCSLINFRQKDAFLLNVKVLFLVVYIHSQFPFNNHGSMLCSHVPAAPTLRTSRIKSTA